MPVNDILPGDGAQGIGYRRLSMPLLAGLLAVPLLFIWFMLRRGYARSTRVAAFSYAAVLFGCSLIGAVRCPPAKLTPPAALRSTRRSGGEVCHTGSAALAAQLGDPRGDIGRDGGRDETVDRPAVQGDLLYQPAGDRLEGDVGHQEHRLNARSDLLIHPRHLIFILEVRHGAQAAHD